MAMLGITVLAGIALLPGAKPVDVPAVLRLEPSFAEEFSGTTLDRSRWNRTFGPMADEKATVAVRSLYSNKERQVYVDPDYLGLRIDPFRLTGGILTITAAPLTPAAKARIMGEVASLPPRQSSSALAKVNYSSGLITTRRRFAQQYGYFEFRAKWSGGKGIWPAFWMLPADGSWPPELDVMEAHGDKPTIVFHTKHSKVEKMEPNRVTVPGTTGEYHRYGMLWTATTLRFYIDGQETVRTTPSADSNKPMYLLANLAIGGIWPGYPDASTRFPATMDIDWIRAWRLPQGWSEERLPTLGPAR